MPPRTRLTAKLLQNLKPSELARDESVRGLFAECGPTGAVSLKVQVDLRTPPGALSALQGRPRRTVKQTLGRWPELSLDEARARATALLAEVRAGRDPRAQAATPASGPAGWTVGRAFEAYVADIAKRPGTDLHRKHTLARLARYLDDWRELPLAALTRETCEARQAQIATLVKARARQRNATGARTANAVIKDLGAVWEFARDYTPLPAVNPARRVTLFGTDPEHHEIPVAELAAWWAAVGKLKNPLRRSMHRIGLLSGLRPRNQCGIARAWVHLDEDRPRIDFPAADMKGRTPFTLPLSPPMVAEVRAALAAGDMLAPGTPWLFPGESSTGHIAVVREKDAPALINRTGHALRHTWKTCARLARVPEVWIEILLAHKLGGVRDIYGSLADQFDLLLDAQCQVSAWILARVLPPAE